MHALVHPRASPPPHGPGYPKAPTYASAYPKAANLGEYQVGPMLGHYQKLAAWGALVSAVCAGDHGLFDARSHQEQGCLVDFQGPEFRDGEFSKHTLTIEVRLLMSLYEKHTQESDGFFYKHGYLDRPNWWAYDTHVSGEE